MIEKFKNARTSVKHEEWAGSRSTYITVANRNESVTRSCRTDGWLLMKWHINRKLVMVQPMKLSTTGLPSIMSAQWVSEELTELHKENRLVICKRLLDRYSVEGDHFLERIFVGDETWIYYHETECKRYSMELKHPHSQPPPPRKKLKTHQVSGKLCLQILGLTIATTRTLSRDGYNSEQC